MYLARLLLSAVLGAILLPVALRPAEAQPPPPAYTEVIQAIRSTKKEPGKDGTDIYALIAILQSEAYPKALREAAERGDDAALRELYQAKYPEGWPRAVAGTPLLSYAAMNGDSDVVRLLIRRGADVNAPNGEGWTALHCAAEGGFTEIVTMLLDKGADAGAQTNRFGETPLMLACGLFGGGRESEACVRLLLRRGAEIDARNSDNETALMFAAARGLLGTVRLLLSKKADATIKDINRRTALAHVEEFERIDAHGEIAYTQDSPTVPTYKLKVFEALIRHGKVRPGRYLDDEAQRQAEKSALEDFLSIARLLRAAEAERRATAQKHHPGKQKTAPPGRKRL